MGNTRQPVLVIGIGNILLRDEGIGVRTVQAMEQIDVPDFVEIVDGATGGADLLDIISDRQKVIVIDAVDTSEEAGTIIKFDGQDILQPDSTETSLHDVGLGQALQMAKQLKCHPEKVTVIGVQPKDISPGLEVSKEIEELIPQIIDMVIAEIHDAV
jgi:hydrogenase maturation protease